MQTSPNNPLALIFDMDGVLVSSERVHWKAYRMTLATEGVDYSWEAYRDTGMGISRENVLKNILGPLEEPRLLELMQLKEDHVRVILEEDGVQRVPGAREMVSSARARGLKTSVATSSRNPELFLEAGGYSNLFDSIICRRDVRLPKPDPQTYLDAAAALELEPARCIAFEDSPTGIEAARAAGIPVIALATTHPAAELSDATTVFDDFHQIELTSLLE
jgi:HAD superfamily hydrolase (TIGR01509 family)